MGCLTRADVEKFQREWRAACDRKNTAHRDRDVVAYDAAKKDLEKLFKESQKGGC